MNRSETALLLTRPEQASRRFSVEVAEKLGHFRTVIISPLMRIVPLEFPEPPGNAEFAFTSENGVAALAARVPPNGRRAWCVGDLTNRRAEDAGFDAASAAGDVAALADLILANGGQRPICHASGRHLRGDLVETLRSAGLEAMHLPVYDQVAQPLSEAALSLLRESCDVMAPVFSPRSARLLLESSADRRARLHLVAISAAAAAEWSARPGEAVRVSPTPDAAGMIRAMGSLFDADPAS